MFHSSDPPTHTLSLIIVIYTADFWNTPVPIIMPGSEKHAKVFQAQFVKRMGWR
jgi:hypothetical protein